MTAPNLLKLYQQLLQFGLNPNEWVIQPFNSQTMEISKIDDPEFCFYGTIENTKWKNIWLASI